MRVSAFLDLSRFRAIRAVAERAAVRLPGGWPARLGGGGRSVHFVVVVSRGAVRLVVDRCRGCCGEQWTTPPGGNPVRSGSVRDSPAPMRVCGDRESARLCAAPAVTQRAAVRLAGGWPARDRGAWGTFHVELFLWQPRRRSIGRWAVLRLLRSRLRSGTWWWAKRPCEKSIRPGQNDLKSWITSTFGRPESSRTERHVLGGRPRALRVSGP